MMEKAVGIHLLADMYGIDSELLTDPDLLRGILTDSVATAKLHPICHASVIPFSERGKGVTGVILLSESHIAFHSYPELSLLMLDVFTCGDAKPEGVLKTFAEVLHPSHYRTTTIFRGEN